MNQYKVEELKAAILFNSQEILPSNDSLDKELEVLVNEANQSGETIKHYIGFEISGQIHIGTGMAAAIKIKQLTDAGVECNIWLANFHTYLNGKLDGKLETINFVATEYFGPIMRLCCEVVGCNMDLVNVLYAKEIYEATRNGETFFNYVMNFAKQVTLSRAKRSISITGKEAGESTDFGTMMYPIMQLADPFFMGIHIVHAGMDQRKVHVLMRDNAEKVNDKYQLKIGDKAIKPIAMHHDLLLSLEVSANSEGDREVSKMSKSKPNSAIWVHDSPELIKSKLKKAYCPIPDQSKSTEETQEEQKWNPLLDWSKNLIFPAGKNINISRPEKFGGDISYKTYEDLENDYLAGNLHPLDLKNGVADTLIDWFAPFRGWVTDNPKGLDKLIEIGK